MATATSCGSADACTMMKSLPPVSPTRRGYDLYFLMFVPTCSHMPWNTPVLPVKWMPARSGESIVIWLTNTGSPGTKLITPGGRPAASSSFIV